MDAVIKELLRNDDAQDLIEYGLLIGIITVASVLALASVGGKVAAYITALNGALP
jgi:Flp pilus assembly pilin Flp